MKRAFYVLKFGVMVAAAQFTLAGAASAEPMKLTVNQAFSVSMGIGQLDKGFDEPAKNDGKDVVLHRSFLFSPAVRIALAVNASHISDAIMPVQKALKAARDKVSPNGGELDKESRKALDAEIEKLGAQPLDIDLTPLSQDDLALDKNTGVTAAMIQALLPIIKR
jgi:hypothetical protein